MSRNKSKKVAGTKAGEAPADRRPPSFDELDADRRGKEPFGNADVLSRWRRIRDGALCLCERVLIEADGKIPKFLSSIVDTVKQAQAEVRGLERFMGEQSDGVDISWLPCEPDDNEGPRVEA